MARILVCQTVTGSSMPELIRARDEAREADLIELRLDGVAALDVPAALAGRPRPVVVTCRPAWDGGRYTAGEDDRLAVLKAAIDAGAEYVDVEWKALRAAPARGLSRLVLSHHDFSSTPADLADRFAAMHAAGADVVKVAVTAVCLSDCIRLRDAARSGGARVAIAMGRAGLLTRVCPWLFGSCWTYAGTAAPGQLPAVDLIDGYRVKETSSSTRVFGVAGPWASAKAFAEAHNAGFRAREFDAVSVPLAARDDGDLQAVADAFGLADVLTVGPAAAQQVLERAARDVWRWARSKA
jgi:3-dehydroquinate dehydratase/shikimate dehydrogenase